MTERAEFTSQRERLKAAVTAPEIVSLANSRTKPLTLERLRIEIPKLYQQLTGEDDSSGSADFFDCEESFGWPDESDRVRPLSTDTPEGGEELPGFTRGMREYGSVEEFAHYLTHGSNEMNYPHKGLNNFLVPFTLHDEFNFGDSLDDHSLMHLAMITEPHFMRLKAIAPEFVGALRQSVQDHLRDKTPISTDPLLVEGLMRAYNIMGRLVKTDDITRHAHFLGYEGMAGDKIEDVHHALAS